MDDPTAGRPDPTPLESIAPPAPADAAAGLAPSATAEAEAWQPPAARWPALNRGGATFGPLTATAWDTTAQRLIAQDAAGATLLVQPLGGATLRLTLLTPGTDAAPPSLAVVGAAPAGAQAYQAVDGGWQVPTAAGPLHLTAAGGLRWERADGSAIFATAPGVAAGVGFGWGQDWAWVWTARNPAAAYFGAGERTGPLDRSGTRMTFWTADVGPHHPGTDAMYQSLPVALAWDATSGTTMGLFCDHPGMQRWDIGRATEDALCLSARAPVLDLYLFAGPTMADVLAQYTALTGRMPLPPRWALGFQQSRWSYFPARQVLEIAQGFRDRDLPGDTIYLDIDYMRGFRDFTFDPQGFPDPAGLIGQLRDLGFRVVTIIDPGVKRDRGYHVYDQMFAAGHYVKWPDGRPHLGAVWPGPCVFPDFFNPQVRAWWGGLHTALLDAGVAGIWDDMNEPVSNPLDPADRLSAAPSAGGGAAEADETRDSDTAGAVGGSWFAPSFPPGVQHNTDHGPRRHEAVHSAYGLQMARATADGLDRLRPAARRFVLTRAGYAGVQRYSAVWTGDNQSWWDHLALAVTMCQGLGLAGVAFVGTDIGGFNDRCTGELYLRWLQFGAVMPLARAHYNSHESGGQAQEPWSFGPEILDYARLALRLRYRLLPYLYSLFHEATQSGAPVLRPLAWEFPHDPRGRTADTQALCGPALLAAPVLRPGVAAQAVYLPAGRWLHLATGDLYDGGADRLVPTPLAHWPLFVRAGSVVPLAEPGRNTEAAAAGNITLLAVAPVRAEAGAADNPQSAIRTPQSPVWYEDDGEGYAYRDGAFRQVPLACAWAGAHLIVTLGPVTGAWHPPTRAVHLDLAGLDAAPAQVTLNGEATVAAWDAPTRRLTLPLRDVAAGATLRVTITP